MKYRPLIGINADYRASAKSRTPHCYIHSGYFDCLLSANALPVFIASDPEWAAKFTASLRTWRLHGPGRAVLSSSSQKPGRSIRGSVYEWERVPADH